jgi:long-chain acyl-CoA synthetase
LIETLMRFQADPRGDDSKYSDWGLLAPARRIPIPDGGPKDVASILDGALARTPGAEAVVGRYARYTYAQLDEHINAAAASLTTLGLRPGDHIACSSTSHPDILIALMAVMRIGAVWTGIPPKFAPAEKAFILQDCEARAFIADAATLARVREEDADLSRLEQMIEMEPGRQDCAWAEMLTDHMGAGRPQIDIDPWAPAAIAYTSGTTGRPKGAVHSQHNIILLGACRSRAHAVEFYSPGKRQGLVQPAAILNVFVVGVVNTWLSGGTCICVDRVDAVGVAEWIRRERIESASLSPATVFDLLTLPEIAPDALDSLRYIALGGGPATEELRALAAARFGSPPLVSYGLTEAPGQVALSSTLHPCPSAASGVAHPHVRIAILDEMGQALPPGVQGEVCVGPRTEGPWAGVYNTMLGYWKNPEATRKALRDGWLHTGDVGMLDETGYLTLTARMNDVIVRGGANIYPAEIERVLGGDPRVRACAVLGRADQRLGQTVEAFIELMPQVEANETTRADLEAGCRAKLAKYKIPTHWMFVPEMPRNAMNKIIKSKLREIHGV